MDIVFIFDDTGSMHTVRKELAKRVTTFVDNLFKTIPNLRIGIIIQNDYCDPQPIQILPLTNKQDLIIQTINQGGYRGGGDFEECYELGLKTLHSDTMQWQSNKRVAVLIGDAPPHPSYYKYNGKDYTLDWRAEAHACLRQGITLYPIQALNYSESSFFYRGLAEIFSTPHLNMSQFHHIEQYLSAISYKETNKLDWYIVENPQMQSNHQLVRLTNSLRGVCAPIPSPSIGLSRYQLSEVPDGASVSIKDYVNNMGITYKAGKGFYQLTKREEIQDYKLVIVSDRKTGEIYEGNDARALLHMPLTRCNFSLTEDLKEKYDVFVQSTSYNRKLMPSTTFLYELEAC